MIAVQRVENSEIQACNFDIDPHTVRLTDKGIWYALKVDDDIASVLCIRVQGHELYIGEVFTDKKYRKKGYFTQLCDYVVNKEYAGLSVSTHALASSRNGFIRCGFEQFAYREFKYGNQWWLRRKGAKIC